jgi:hypothetical protein
MGPAVEDVQLGDRRPAEAVDHQRHVVAGLVGQVGGHRLDQLVDDRVGVGELLAPAPRLAVRATSSSTMIVAILMSLASASSRPMSKATAKAGDRRCAGAGRGG